MIENDMLNRYRPKNIDEVIGHSVIKKSLNAFFNTNIPHAFMFIGKPGTGKTTFARIIAKQLECSNPLEIDAATYNGVDFVRDLTESLNYCSFINKNKVVIIDEVHALSNASWQALLKTVENPLNFVYFIFCTTEHMKVPDAFKDQRLIVYNLKDISEEEIEDLLTKIYDELKPAMPKKALTILAQEAYGSPRKAINLFSKCFSCSDMQDIYDLLEMPKGKEGVEELFKLLLGKIQFKYASKILKDLKSTNPENIKRNVIDYFTACILNATTEKDLLRFLNIVEVFSENSGYTTFSSIVVKTYQILLNK